MQKRVNLGDLVKSFPTNIHLQKLASIQKRTSPVKFAHLAEESENGSISNLSTKVRAGRGSRAPGRGRPRPAERRPADGDHLVRLFATPLTRRREGSFFSTSRATPFFINFSLFQWLRDLFGHLILSYPELPLPKT